ncbi:Hypothetical protein PBC10988_32270 [Planctomycetales bacterium 10988]|nr:Hypothetical protein PBC10988_32270 [Planctomycetales bacterium 10988]
MAQPRLRSPDQPFPVQLLLGFYEFCASMKLAVILILAAALGLAWGTIVESKYGTAAVQFGIWQTWWFELLNIALAVNIFCAAAIRFPWKRHQTGFVITHIGLLILLYGCYLQRKGGIDSQMPILEKQENSLAHGDNQHIMLQVQPINETPAEQTFSEAVNNGKTIAVPFRAGPFNWSFFDWSAATEDLDWTNPRDWVPLAAHLSFQLSTRDVGLLSDPQGLLQEEEIQLEVLDYYSDSVEMSVPYLRVELTVPENPQQRAQMETLGMGTPVSEGPKSRDDYDWMPVELHARSELNSSWERNRQTVGGGTMVFLTADAPAERASFLAQPDPQLFGEHGQLVLAVGDEVFRFNIDELEDNEARPLGETGLEITLKRFVANAIRSGFSTSDRLEIDEAPGMTGRTDQPAVEVLVSKIEADSEKEESSEEDSEEEQEATDDSSQERILLIADIPELNEQAEELGVYGAFWFSRKGLSAEERMAGGSRGRIDFLHGDNQKLYYRYWNGQELVRAEEMPTDGTLVEAFKMPFATLHMVVDKDDFVSSAEPAIRVFPKAFQKDLPAGGGRRAAHLRMTVNGEVSEFWIVGIGLMDDLLEQVREFNPSLKDQMLEAFQIPEKESLQVRTFDFGDRRITVTMPTDTVDIGTLVELEKFERKLDPGTSQPSHYGSVVSFLEPQDPEKAFQKDVAIVMNAPVDFSDPHSGRTYRLFQESFRGPYPGPSNPHGPQMASDERFVSILTVNYDPGRGVKYLGCLLVVAGIATMFYMRAYFFKPKKSTKSKTTPSQPSEKEQPSLEEVSV